MSQQEDAFQKQIADLSNSYEEKLKITSHLRSLVTELQNEKTSLLRSLEVANEEVKTAKQQICDLEEKVKNLLVRPAAGSGFTTESNVTSGTKSLCDLTTKLVKSQQETEFWKLEYELNKMKHSKTLLVCFFSSKFSSTRAHTVCLRSYYHKKYAKLIFDQLVFRNMRRLEIISSRLVEMTCF